MGFIFLRKKTERDEIVEKGEKELLLFLLIDRIVSACSKHKLVMFFFLLPKQKRIRWTFYAVLYCIALYRTILFFTAKRKKSFQMFTRKHHYLSCTTTPTSNILVGIFQFWPRISFP